MQEPPEAARLAPYNLILLYLSLEQIAAACPRLCLWRGTGFADAPADSKTNY